MAQTVFLEAINQAIQEEMRRDESVYILGEDIRRAIYGATADLLSEFGEKRVLDTPLSEEGFFGAAIGSSLVGMRPVVETLTSFMWVAMDQLVSQAAKMRYMFGGQATLPVVFRASMFYGAGSAAHHSDRSYPMFMNMPGIKIIVPSNPADMKGLLKTAIRDDDPVFLVNDKKLINLTGFVPDEDYVIELGKGRYMRRGADVTLVGMSYTSVVCQKAAEQLAEIGIDAEVIDMMSLSPFDEDILIESVAKTNNVVIVDEDTPRASMASEFAAVIADKAFDHLDAPVKRVTSPHSPVPYNSALEQEFMPQPADVVGTVKNLLGRE